VANFTARLQRKITQDSRQPPITALNKVLVELIMGKAFLYSCSSKRRKLMKVKNDLIPNCTECATGWVELQTKTFIE